jgi:hypothetical protein
MEESSGSDANIGRSATEQSRPDPLETFRKQLLAMSQLAASELDKPEFRMKRAIALYQVGNIESALEDLDWLLLHGESVPLPEATAKSSSY